MKNTHDQGEDSKVSCTCEVDAQKQLEIARDIIRRLLSLVSDKLDEYNEETCPNGKPACLTCRLVSEAKRFVNDKVQHGPCTALPYAWTCACGLQHSSKIAHCYGCSNDRPNSIQEGIS